MREKLAEKISQDINDLVHQKGSETSELSADELIEKIRHMDYLLHLALDKTDHGLNLVTGHYSAIAEALEGQTFWNNTNRLNSELFQNYFNMSMLVQRGINNLTEVIRYQNEETAR
jgi:hypothetical protein